MTGESQWADTEQAAAAAAAMQVWQEPAYIEATSAVVSNAAVIVSSSVDAAPPYSTEWDVSTNQWYYVNQWTGTSTWELPNNINTNQMVASAATTSSMPADMTTNYDTPIVITTQVRAVSSNDLWRARESNEWNSLYDEENGMWYYVHEPTGLTQWESPWPEEGDAWEQVWDDVTQAYYHFNRNTGESQW